MYTYSFFFTPDNMVGDSHVNCFQLIGLTFGLFVQSLLIINNNINVMEYLITLSGGVDFPNSFVILKAGWLGDEGRQAAKFSHET